MSSNRAMSSPIFVPDSLKFYVNRLSFSKNRVRLQALSTTRVGPNGQVIVRLPSNTMVNLASLTMTGAVGARINGGVLREGVALPTNFDFSFIETLSLIANGGIITQPFTNYKLLANTLNDIYGSNAKVYARNALQGSLPSPLIDYFTQAGGAGFPDADACFQPFSINNWISATQTMTPSYISTNLLGDLELRLTMTGTQILATGSTLNGLAIDGLQAKATWEMRDINFYIETASVQSSFLEQAIASKLAAGDPINVPFENVFSFSQSNDGTGFNQRFSVSSQSVNKILAITQLNSDLQANGQPEGANNTTAATQVPQQRIINGIPQCLRRNYNGAALAQFSVNNQYSPNYQIDSQINQYIDTVGGNNFIGGINNVTIPSGSGAVTDGLLTNTPAINSQLNLQFSNALVETRAAMDINDYDYDQADKLTSTTQMPFEYFGSGCNPIVQPPTNSLFFPPQAGATPIPSGNLETGDAGAFPQADLPARVIVTANAAGFTQAAWNATGWPDLTAQPVVGDSYVLTTLAPAATAGANGSTVISAAVLPVEPRPLSHWFPYSYKEGILTYLQDKYVLATSFDLDACDKDRLVSGINTLGSNAQMFLNVVGANNFVTAPDNAKNTSTIFVLCTSMVQIYQGATLKIIQ